MKHGKKILLTCHSNSPDHQIKRKLRWYIYNELTILRDNLNELYYDVEERNRHEKR